jgi:hypothetical protein
MKRSIWPGMRPGRVPLFALFAAGSLGAGQPVLAGNFQMFPGRLVFDKGSGVQTVTVINSEQSPTVIKTSLEDLIMTPEGGLARPGEIGDRADLREIAARVRSARALLMVAPQQMAAVPQGVRVIRVRAASASLPPGEYRSHLAITSLPISGDGGQPEQTDSGQVRTAVNFALTMTIPVIVRIGPRDARAELVRPRLTTVDLSSAAGAAGQKAPALQVDLVRRGSSSLYGSVEVRSAKAGKKDPPLGQLRGTAVYPEIEGRPVTVNLKRAPQPGERLLISFWDQERVGKKPLAQVEYQVP